MTSSLHNGGMLEVCPGLMLSYLSFCVYFSVSTAFAFLIAAFTLFRVCL